MQAYLIVVVVVVALIGGCSSSEDKTYDYELETHMGQYKDGNTQKISLTGFAKSGGVFSSHKNEGQLVESADMFPEVRSGKTYTSKMTMDIPVDKIKSFSIEWTDRAAIEMERRGLSTEFKDPIAVDKVVIKPLYDVSASPISFCTKPGTPVRVTKRLEMNKC